MKKYVISIFAVLCVVLDTYAGTKNDGIKYRNDWHLPETFSDSWYCKGDAISAGMNPRTGSHTNFNIDMRNYKNYAASYYIAREMTEGGVKFCKTIVAAGRGGCTRRPYTQYYDDGGDCFWLCRDGYNGKGCTQVQSPNFAHSMAFFKTRAKTWDSIKLSAMTVGKNIEDNIPMFFQNQYKYCANNEIKGFDSTKNQEHDVILGLFKIGLESSGDEKAKGLRFVTVPMVVRAGGVMGCFYDSQHYAWPMITWLTGSKYDNYLCPEGWVRDTDSKGKSACIPDPKSDLSSSNNLCSGFSKDKFNPEKHHIKQGSPCNEYRCNAGTAFKSKTDHTCVPCPATDADIPSLYYVGSDGLCKKCDVGQWPVETNDVFKCEPAQELSNAFMQYGTDSVPGDDLASQCWTKDSPDKYKSCVTGTCPKGETFDAEIRECSGDGGLRFVPLSESLVKSPNSLIEKKVDIDKSLLKTSVSAIK